MRNLELMHQTQFITKEVIGKPCSDYDPTAPWAVPAIRSALQSSLRVDNCTALAEHCSGDVRLLRTLCPETCGCKQPQSGLYANGGNEGCPRAGCLSTPEYRDLLASIPCRDYTLPELVQNVGWATFIRQFVSIRKQLDRKRADNIERAGASLLAKGCPGLQGVRLNKLRKILCEPSEHYGSLRPFCPVSCGCQAPEALLNTVECPTQCLANASA